MGKVSFVIPCYCSEHTISDVVSEIVEVMSHTDYKIEIILVDDASVDCTWHVIEKLVQKHFFVKGIALAKNFGQHAAIMAGYRECTGHYVVSLDDDGQSPVDQIPEMLQYLEKNHFDVVFGTCDKPGFGLFRRLGSRLNRWMAELLFDRPKQHRIVSTYVMKKYIVDEITRYINPYVYMSGLIFRATNQIGFLEVHHRVRQSGSSRYSLSKLINLWMNGVTAFSIRPLRAASFLGIFISFLGMLAIIVTIVKKIFENQSPMGWSSLICVFLFIGGIVLMAIGMIGEYIGRIYMCVNLAPQYVIRQQISGKTEE